MINRLCEQNNIAKFYDGDTTDRVAVAEFAKTVVDEIFANRSK